MILLNYFCFCRFVAFVSVRKVMLVSGVESIPKFFSKVLIANVRVAVSQL